jgi:hypothetical protein
MTYENLNKSLEVTMEHERRLTHENYRLKDEMRSMISSKGFASGSNITLCTILPV